MKKIVSVMIAVMMVLALSVSAFAADSYMAYIGFADSSWSHSGFHPDTAGVEITGDGQYVIETDQFAGAADILVFVVDFEGMNADNPNITAVIDSIEIDGTAIELDSSKVLSGDLEENGNYRLEIYNEYGAGTTADPPINHLTAVNSSIKITFTVSGMSGEPAAAETETPAETTESSAAVVTEDPATGETETTPVAEAPSTGIALAVIPAIMALGAVCVSKKR